MKEQRRTFDDVAGIYAAVRPHVPPVAVEALLRHLELRPGSHVVEVGCGTGQLTQHLVRTGAHVTAIDPGARLIQECARALEGHDITFVESPFEVWGPGETAYEAVTACQAAHWIDPAEFLDCTSAALSPGGRMGLLWHIDTSSESAFWKATQPLYDSYLPDADDKPPRTIPLHVDAYVRQSADDPRFAASPLERFPWSREFDEEGYVRLLETHSPVRMLDVSDREAFIEGHRPLIAALGGRVTRTYETVLLCARLA